MDTVKVKEKEMGSIHREPFIPEEPFQKAGKLERLLTSSVLRYTLRVLVFIIIFLLVMLLFPKEAG